MKQCTLYEALINDLQCQIRSLMKENNFFVNTCLKCMDCLNPKCPIRYRKKDVRAVTSLATAKVIDIKTGKSVG